MGQKVSPISLRLGGNRRSDSVWYSDKNYATLVLQDATSRKYLASVWKSVRSIFGRVLIWTTPYQQSVFVTYASASHLPDKKAVRPTTSAVPKVKTTTGTADVTQSQEANALQPLTGTVTHAFQKPSNALMHYLFLHMYALRQQHLSCSDRQWTFLTSSFKYQRSVLQTVKLSSNQGSGLKPKHWPLTKRITVNGRCTTHLMQQLHRINTVAPAIASTSTKVQLLLDGQPKAQTLGIQPFPTSLRIIPCQLETPFDSAQCFASWVAHCLQKKPSFRTMWKEIVKYQKTQPFAFRRIKGFRVTCAGRFEGAEIARIESKKWGQTPTHVFSHHLDYGTAYATTAYGVLGVKVWVCYTSPSTQLKF